MAVIVDSEGNELKAGEDKPVTLDEHEKIEISGTTVSNGQVKLYIFSEPQEGATIADGQGSWSYTIESIEPGNHRVEVEVTDPATGKVS